MRRRLRDLEPPNVEGRPEASTSGSDEADEGSE